MRERISAGLVAAAAIAALAGSAVPSQAATCEVKAPEIRLRKSQSMKAKVLTVLKKGERVSTAGGCAGGWVKVATEGGHLSGYVGGWALAAAPELVEIKETPIPPEGRSGEPAAAAAVEKESPSNEKLAMQITELRLSVLGIERRMDAMTGEMRKVEAALKREKGARKIAAGSRKKRETARK